jgi:tetratricopeptide (TPR) repeat protein
VPALVGRGEAALEAGDNRLALASFEAAVAADPGQAALKPRIEALRFRGLQDEVALARKSVDAGRFDEARAAYQRAIASSPQSAFLYRELAGAERREGNLTDALQDALKASEMEPAEPRNLILAGEIYEAQGDYPKAADLYGAALAIEPNDAIEGRLDDLRKKAAFAAMPAEYQGIEASPTVTRGQLAALLGVHLDDLLKRAARLTPGVITDTRNHWATPWILSVTRAGLMESYPNHTFQPDATVRRSDLATAVSRALALIALERPDAAAAWRNARRRFPDVPPTHLSYPAVSLAVESGVMTTGSDGSFQLTRPVTGIEAVLAVKKLESLAERRTP